MSEWQPIDTAPKEPMVRDRGPKIIVWWPHWRDTVIIAWWSPYGWRADEALSADGVPPTHWMPLPEPPQP